MTIKAYLFLALAGFGVFYLLTWMAAVRKRETGQSILPPSIHYGIGFIANFFDTLGVGSFATTTSMYKLRNLVPDERIPGTLNVGHTLPTVAQAFIYIAIVEVDMATLVLLIAASVIGMWLGAGIVASWPRRNIQIGMSVALFVAALLTLRAIFDSPTGGGMDQGLVGVKLAAGIFGNFALGALMSLGIGLYGPCLIMVSLLGMDPRAAFPIMMGSCAFLMPVGSAQFIRKSSYSLPAAVGLALGGVPAVLIAAFIVKSLDLYYVRWLVVLVVIYTAVSLFRSALTDRKATTA